MKSSTIHKIHRWLGLVFSLAILLFSGSGLIHVILTRTQPDPKPAQPAERSTLPADVIKVSPADILKKHPESPVLSMKLINISGKPFYQTYLAGNATPVYLDASDGIVNPVDGIHASEIAAAHLGDQNVEFAEYLEEFNDEYDSSFRSLPVYRFNLRDGRGTRVYVSTATHGVVLHTDNRKQFVSSIFNNFHKLDFIPNKRLRDWTISIATAGAFATALLSIILFFATRPGKPAAS